MTARIESLRRRPRRRLLMVGLLLASLLGVATATPAFAATVIAATPATGLVDGQTIHLSIGGFGTGTSVGIAQCVNDFDYNRHCSGVQGGTVDAFGGLEIDVQVWALITTSEFGDRKSVV